MTSARSSCSEERRRKPEALDPPVSERHLLPTQAQTGSVEPGIDVEQLTAWFAVHVPQALPPLRFVRVAGGHSCLTFVVVAGDGARFVLRRPPMGATLATAHDVGREHHIMSALAGTEVPVPAMLAACQDPGVIGSPFFVMSHVDGFVLHEALDVPRALPDPDARRRSSESMIDALASLHALDPVDVGLSQLSRTTGYLDRQLHRWSRQWAASRTRELEGMERLHRWLVEHRPHDPPGRIVHGDFRLGNAIVAADGTVRAVLDWELCTLGDPLADISYLLRSWVEPHEPLAPGGVPPPTQAGGFLNRQQLVERYEQRTGRELGDLDYWLAFNAWRSAAIGEGVYRRYLDGAMGERPDDLDRYARGVEFSMAAGLEFAGLAD